MGLSITSSGDIRAEAARRLALAKSIARAAASVDSTPVATAKNKAVRYNILMNRRAFVQSGLAFAAAAHASGRLPIATAVEYNMLPEGVTTAERFQMAKDA